ncbi:MAG: 2-C-methyl-D-erythritol 4-phosphate cytidylyltransferase, partial [Atopobiaceae bacterium]|nr:2-C-methyl-D-erythritol 4-phosphate cytidylyltransferase [Atopobiaceae bacterium]
MRTHAVIIAGGSGARMGQDIPKQFINVFDKPVLIYTLESFQRHELVDDIVV